MIDTIVVRIHDLIENEATVNYISRHFQSIEEYAVSIQRGELSSHFTYKMKSYGQGKSHLGVIAKGYSPSSLAPFTIMINPTRNFIEVNFSLPKYVYGTNIYQWLDELNFPSRLEDAYMYSIKNLYRWINRFLNKNLNFYGLYELVRLDACYNHFFPDIDVALTALEHIKSISVQKKGKALRSQPYLTSFMTVNSLYSFKVYHKGTEFRDKDKVVLREVNKIQSKQRYDLDGLQKVADCILRYEMTSHSKHLSYLWKMQTIRDELGRRLPDGRAVHSCIRQAIDEFGFTTGNQKDQVRDYCLEHAVEEIEINRYFQLRNKKRNFFFVADQSEYNSEDMYQLLTEFYSFFEVTFKKYRLEKVEVNIESKDLPDYVDGKKIHKARLLNVIKLFKEGKTWKDIELIGLQDRATIYRLKKLCKRLKIAELAGKKVFFRVPPYNFDKARKFHKFGRL